MKQLLRNVIRRLGFDLVRYNPAARLELGAVPDLTEDEKNLLFELRPYTLTSIERMAALLDAVTYLAKNKIPGDIAECGVWRGGSMMLVARTLMALGDTSRDLYLYDTYEGMSDATSDDVSFNGMSAVAEMQKDARGTGIWAYASIEDVRANMMSTGYPEKKIHFVKGKVEDTIPGTVPRGIALLRLDTDWYESTKHELVHLYPLLHNKGILILDDYGHWLGARKAVDEYFSALKSSAYMHRIDYTGRMLVGKPE